ncbi:Butirosin biosynthesis protein H, N-terminal [Lentzea fradiae]|uniref:Butirosin biosynthesis protein H, N-terminal n=1 Tax=Lentzea fradiae TaxID=200378 RepID=A0A1G8BDD9_9PSEU|nr:BtrH N-terminal domain-containing protein [Lentzea fradiae]SDH31219.1 Butirosin biosynthesis protein H, N-terminal [Lentzea fradiae]
MRVLLDDLDFWFHDLCSCLQDCFGTLLLRHGQDPVAVMGAAWEFHHAPGPVATEEFYHPAPRPTLGDNLMPHHPVRATWREQEDVESSWQDIRASIIDGRPAIAAVDNFHMPIRPAYGDVHAAHLMVVWGFDDEAGEVYVLESTPPQYSGPVSLADFQRARSSANDSRPDTRDYFFAGAGIRGRWIDVTVDGAFPAVEREWVADVVTANARGFAEPAPGPGWSGLTGLTTWLEGVCDRADDIEDAGVALAELYTAGWAAQSAAALHADFLRDMGNRFGCDPLVHAGRQVDRLANQWTPLRILGAHGSTTGHRHTDQLRDRVRRFTAGHRDAVARLEAAAAALVK